MPSNYPPTQPPPVKGGTILADIESAVLHSAWLKMQALKLVTVAAAAAGTWLAAKTGTDQAQDTAAIGLILAAVVTYGLGTIQSYFATHNESK